MGQIKYSGKLGSVLWTCGEIAVFSKRWSYLMSESISLVLCNSQSRPVNDSAEGSEIVKFHSPSVVSFI